MKRESCLKIDAELDYERWLVPELLAVKTD